MVKNILRSPVVATLPLLLFLLSGCATFQGSRTMDMTPFAENTARMFSEAGKVSRTAKWNYLKPHASIPELQALRAKGATLIRGLRGILMYSNQLVALNMSSKSDKEKNRFLASYFRQAAAKVAETGSYDSIGVTQTMLDTVYLNIERAETFREGIEAASPLVNAVVLTMLRKLDEIDEMGPVFVTAIDREIEKAYADKRHNYDELVRLQTRFHHEITLLYDGRTGNQDALAELLDGDPSMREFFSSPDKATPAHLRAADDALTARLERVSVFLGQLDTEKSVYIAKQEELESLRMNLEERLRIARDAIMVWAQSHRNLGAGIPVPPMIDIGGLATGAVKKVSPIP